jgi:hypothetical protein
MAVFPRANEVWETLALKKSLFAGVFDSPTGEVSFAKLGRKTVLQAVKEIFAEQPGRPKPVIDHAPSIPVIVAQRQSDGQTQQPGVESAKRSPVGGTPSVTAGALHGDGIALAAASFLEAGLKLMESFAATVAGNSSGAPVNHFDQALAALFTRDTQTNRPALTIPLPESVTPERLTGALSSLLKTLTKAAASPGNQSRPVEMER